MSSSKCPVCNKKANMLGIVCKCGNKYCMEHRMPEDHNCAINYKARKTPTENVSNHIENSTKTENEK